MDGAQLPPCPVIGDARRWTFHCHEGTRTIRPRTERVYINAITRNVGFSL